jgi:Double zinc ribbon
VICSNCGRNLPEGSRYCLSCGAAVPATASGASSATPATECSKCNAKLPLGSLFCPMCSQAVIGAFSPWAPRLPQPRKSRSALWLLLPALFLALGWAALSDSHAAQDLQRLTNLSHAETIAPATFTVNARSFAYYRFGVPAGAREVSVSGQFDSASADKNADIEVWLLTESDLVNWQYGYSPAAYYSSGQVSRGDLEAALPPGAGSYCLVFNNKFSQRGAKSVHAALTLHYKKWWPLF